MVPRKAYPGYARVLYPGYFTNKYPLWAKSNIPQTRTHHRLPYPTGTVPAHPHTRTPAHPHTQTSNPRPTTQPHPPSRLNQGGGVYLVSTIFLSKILRSTSCKPSLSIASWLVTIITCKLTTVTCAWVCLCVIQPQ